MGIEELLLILGIFHMQSYFDLKLESDMFQEVARFAQQLYKLSVRGGH